ncbi:Dcun1d2, partial [Symbiodinium sp. CCMP2456]
RVIRFAAGSHRQAHPDLTSPLASHPPPPQQSPSEHPRFHYLSWNAGGLSSSRYQQLSLWLQRAQHLSLVAVQETHWNSDWTFRTHGWAAYHSPSTDKVSGILVLVNMRFFRPDRVQFSEPIQGRLVHVRLEGEPSLDVLIVYQFLYASSAAHPGQERLDRSLEKRAHLWAQLHHRLAGLPIRNGLLLTGDFNCDLHEDGQHVGGGLRTRLSRPQPDQELLQNLLRTFSLQALNTWRGAGRRAETFFPANGGRGTQIDFAITRQRSSDAIARLAQATWLPFVETFWFAPPAPLWLPQDATGTQASTQAPSHASVENLSDQLIQAWHTCAPDARKPKGQEGSPLHELESSLLAIGTLCGPHALAADALTEVVLPALHSWQANMQALAARYPQYAYIGQRSVEDSIERACAHCAAARDALIFAGVAPELMDLILHIHRQSSLLIQHKEHDIPIALHSGVRQGCGLAPALWSIFICYALHLLSARIPLTSLTAFSDDILAQWDIDTPDEALKALRDTAFIIDTLHDLGMNVSDAKTVIIDRSNSVRPVQRLRLWQACVFSAIRYGLTSTGLPPRGPDMIRQAVAKQIRLVLKSPSWITHETTTTLFQRFDLQDPISQLAQILDNRRARPLLDISAFDTPARRDWHNLLPSFFEDAQSLATAPATTPVTRERASCVEPDAPASAPTARLVEVTSVVSRPFSCPHCPQTFATLIAMRTHCTRTHKPQPADEADAQDRYMRYAVDGMPQCSLCKRLHIRQALQHCPICHQWFTRTQDLQTKEAEAELSLLQCWGDQPMDLGALTGKRHAALHGQDMEEEDHEDSSKDREKAVALLQGWFRRRQQSPTQDPDLAALCSIMSKLLLRHEDEMGVDRSENQFVMFFKRESQVSLLPQFITKSQHWHELRDQKNGELTLSLRSFLYQTLISELAKRLQAVSETSGKQEQARQLQVFLPRKEEADELMIPFLVFNQEGRRLEPRGDSQPIPLSRMLELLAEIQKAALHPLSVLRFHATQKLTGPLRGPTVPFILQVGGRTDQANLLHRHLTSLTHSSIWQLVGGSLRMERMGRSALANELA